MQFAEKMNQGAYQEAAKIKIQTSVCPNDMLIEAVRKASTMYANMKKGRLLLWPQI